MATITFTSTGGITITGAMSGASFTATSSRKVKKDISPCLLSAVDIINSTDIVNFKFINDDENTQHVGFIAEDTDPLLSTSHMNSMDYTNCIGVLMKAVQELSKRVEELEKKKE